MFFKLIQRLFQRRRSVANKAEYRLASLEKANRLMNSGDLPGAVVVFRDFLKSEPYDLDALNNLGFCLVSMGDDAGAAAVFEQVSTLDDTYVLGLVNRAKVLNDHRRSAEALPLLRQAKICEPNSPHIDAVYGNTCLNLGDSARAKMFALQAWLGNFDDLRTANSHLVDNAYGDFDELQLAAEHRFWAETLKPVVVAELATGADVRRTTADLISSGEPQIDGISSSKRIRIGYWSPDFRNHSVRYFSRPLLEGHDPEKFEVFLYHDFPSDDEQTGFIAAVGEHFHDICDFSDDELHALILSHRLDILVELTGHMSYNRVALLQRRFATVQITGLGYPPTTGLRSVDAKILDRHTFTPDATRYYAEYPLVLPGSFWCFDPKEDVPLPAAPPVERNGHITFGCVGNLAKISDRILSCWGEVLLRVPHSRLLIRSLTLEDIAAEEAIQRRLRDAGLPLERVDLRKPEGGAAYFASYNEIDIILDTFPFNGGTTTCFATYMGTAVVSWYGDSLVSRMGLSVLSNLGVSELAVSNAEDYVERAVTLAGDIPFLQRFRREVRGRYQRSALGNGKLFASDFEAACRDLLNRKAAGSFHYAHDIPLLPANELVRRVFILLQHGQREAADRVLDYCLKNYPQCGGAHNILAQKMSAEGRPEEAVKYLLSHLTQFTEQEQVSTLISAARIFLVLRQQDKALEALNRLGNKTVSDAFDQVQVKLYRTACLLTGNDVPSSSQEDTELISRRIHFLVPCDDSARFDVLCRQIDGSCWRPKQWAITFERCSEAARIPAYEAALQNAAYDILVICQKNIEIHNPMFFVEAVHALNGCDVLGFAGALRWTRLNWRQDNFAFKAGSLIVESDEVAGYAELQLLGAAEVIPAKQHAAVLDGSLFAVKRGVAVGLPFNSDLQGAENLLEEYWLYTLGRKRRHLSVHCNLGVLINKNISLRADNAAVARGIVAEKFYFNPLDEDAGDNLRATVPATSAGEAVRLLHLFYNPSVLEEATVGV